MKTKNDIIHPQTVEIPQPLEIHPSVSPKAAELLNGVIEVLMREPGRYNQQRPNFSECGAPCCIVGHMEGLAKSVSIGLTKQQLDSIFLVTRWPAQFISPAISRWEAAGMPLYITITEGVTAPEGIARIEHFLRTGE